jgi:hypothetical protein
MWQSQNSVETRKPFRQASSHSWLLCTLLTDEPQDFYLDFDVLSDEIEIEFRIAPTSGYTLTLEYIQLARRLI